MAWYVDKTGMGYQNPTNSKILAGKKIVMVGKSDWDWKAVTDEEPVSLFKLAEPYMTKYCDIYNLPYSYAMCDNNTTLNVITSYIRAIVEETSASISNNYVWDVMKQATVSVANQLYPGLDTRLMKYPISPKVIRAIEDNPENIYLLFCIYGVLPYTARLDLASLYLGKYAPEDLVVEDNLCFVGTGKAGVSQWMFIEQYTQRAKNCDVFIRPSYNSLFNFEKARSELESFLQASIINSMSCGGEVDALTAKEKSATHLSYMAKSVELAKSAPEGTKNLMLVKGKRDLTRYRKLPIGTPMYSKLDLSYTEERSWPLAEAALMFCYSCNSIEASLKCSLLSSPVVFDRIINAYIGVPVLKHCSKEDTTLCIIDTETTGLDTAKDKIIEFAGVKVRNGEIIDTIDIFRKSQADTLSDEITNLTGITRETLEQEGLDDEEFIAKVNEFLTDSYVMAYNSPFDVAILESDLGWFCNKNIDLLDIVKCLYPNLHSYKLGEVGSALGLQGQNTHRAIDDVMLTYELYNKCLKEYNVYVDGKQEELQRERQLLVRTVDEACEKAFAIPSMRKLISFVHQSIANNYKELAIKILGIVGVPSDFIQPNWDDKQSVGANLRRFILNPSEIIERNLFGATVYDMKDCLYDTVFLESYDKAHYDFIKSRAKVIYIDSGDVGVDISPQSVLAKHVEVKTVFNAEDMANEIKYIRDNTEGKVCPMMYTVNPQSCKDNFNDYNYRRTLTGVSLALTYNYIRYKSQWDKKVVHMQLSNNKEVFKSFCESLLEVAQSGKTDVQRYKNTWNAFTSCMQKVNFVRTSDSVKDLLTGYSIKLNSKAVWVEATRYLNECGIDLRGLQAESGLALYSVLALGYTEAIEDLFLNKRVPVLLEPLGSVASEVVSLIYGMEKEMKEAYSECTDEGIRKVSLAYIEASIKRDLVFEDLCEIDIRMLTDVKLRTIETAWRSYLQDGIVYPVIVNLTRYPHASTSIKDMRNLLYEYMVSEDCEFYLYDETGIWAEKLGSLRQLVVKSLKEGSHKVSWKYKRYITFRRAGHLINYLKETERSKLQGFINQDYRLAGLSKSSNQKKFKSSGLSKVISKGELGSVVLSNRYYTRRNLD